MKTECGCECKQIKHNKDELKAMKTLYKEYVNMIEANQFINILGTKYKIIFASDEEYVKKYNLPDNTDGFTCNYAPLIIIRNYIVPDFSKITIIQLINRINCIKHILKHEIIHAYFKESGLTNPETCQVKWAHDEQLIEWLSTQLDKLAITANNFVDINICDYEEYYAK